jgi:hypothetical protein
MLYYIILKLYPIISTFSKINKSLFGLLIIDIIAYMYNLSRPKRVPYLDENGKQVFDENGNLWLTVDEVETEQNFKNIVRYLGIALCIAFLATSYHFNELKTWKIALVICYICILYIF